MQIKERDVMDKANLSDKMNEQNLQTSEKIDNATKSRGNNGMITDYV